MSFASALSEGKVMRVLILGGTSEARKLGEHLAVDPRFAATISLAGRTSAPARQPLPTRVGGFGGAEGLARYLAEDQIDALIDATHPYATQISQNAKTAADASGCPFASILRPEWTPTASDHWIDATDAADAAQKLGPKPRRVFLTMGRLELEAFADAPQHGYIARSIDAPGDLRLPPDLKLITARPPFDAEAEQALMRQEAIDIVVTKNSGSPETFGKIEAARTLRLPVIMIARPAKASGTPLRSINDAICWLETLLAHRRSPRGV